MKNNEKKAPKIQARFEDALRQCRSHVQQAVVEYQANVHAAYESMRNALGKTH